MKKATPKQVVQHKMRVVDEYRHARGLDKDARLPDKVYGNPPESLYCAKPDCKVSWEIPMDISGKEAKPMKLCSWCKWTYYCSVSPGIHIFLIFV